MMSKLRRTPHESAAAAWRTGNLNAQCSSAAPSPRRIKPGVCFIVLILGVLRPIQGEESGAAALADGTDLLQLTRANREVLSDDFPGFRSKLTVHVDGQEHRGTMLFRPPVTLGIELGDKDVRKNVKSAVRSLLSHRMRADGSPQENLRPAEKDDRHPLGRRVLLGDKYDSSYRIRDRRILEVDRKMKESRLVISVLETETTASGKYLPTRFFVTVFDWESGAVKSASVYTDVYQRVGGEYLPRSRRIIATKDGGTETFLVEWEEIELLKPSSGD